MINGWLKQCMGRVVAAGVIAEGEEDFDTRYVQTIVECSGMYDCDNYKRICNNIVQHTAYNNMIVLIF